MPRPSDSIELPPPVPGDISHLSDSVAAGLGLLALFSVGWDCIDECGLWLCIVPEEEAEVGWGSGTSLWSSANTAL